MTIINKQADLNVRSCLATYMGPDLQVRASFMAKVATFRLTVF